MAITMMSGLRSMLRPKSLLCVLDVSLATLLPSCIERSPTLVRCLELPIPQKSAALDDWRDASADPSEPDAFEPDAGPLTANAGACPTGMVLIPGGGFQDRNWMEFFDKSDGGWGGLTVFYVPKPSFVPPFCIDALEVTLAAYRGCVAARACTAPPWSKQKKCGYREADWLRRPMICASYPDAVAFCKFVGKEVPNRAQWERASGVADGRVFPWGDLDPIPGEVCWFRAEEGPCDVGTSPLDVSPFGVYDMAGNAQEWLTYEAEFDAGTSGKKMETSAGEWFRLPSSHRTWNLAGVGRRTSIEDRMGFRCAKNLRSPAVQPDGGN